MAHDGHAAKPVILVVDDSPDNLTVAAAALADHYRVLLANSAKRGLEIARGHVRPDMILLDVMMPEMDGYEVCIKLKQTPETGDIPVIFLTSSADSDNERRGLELGAVDYVTKPFEPRLLLARVKAHLSVRAQADSRVARAISADHEVATRKLAAILSTTSDGFWTVTRDGYITSANVGYCQQLGYEVAAVVGQHISQFTEFGDRNGGIAAHLARIAEDGRTERFERSHRHQGGHLVPVEIAVTYLPEYDEFAVFIHDVSAHRRAAESERIVVAEREAAARRLDAIVATTSDGFWIIDLNGRIRSVNDVYCAMVGLERASIVGQHIQFFEAERPSTESIGQHLRRIVDGAGHELFETRHRHRDGHDIWVEVSVSHLARHDEFVVFLRDITARKRKEHVIQLAAFHDALTELPNRRMLIDACRRAVATEARRGGQGALMLVDLDQFKSLNDSMGHEYGDAYLREVGERLRKCVRDSDTVARLGGDEFAVLLVDLGTTADAAASHAAVVAERIRAALTEDYTHKKRIYRGSCSIGVALFGRATDELDRLLECADSAMYLAKQEGRNLVRFFDVAMQQRLTARDAQTAELRDAIADAQFLLHYQGQVDANGQPIGAEALVRWLHPARGLVSPGQFIALAEETGLIVELGLWVLRAACVQLRGWQASPTTRGLPLSVNVSARQFGQADFIHRVQEILEQTEAPPHLLKLELTESTALRNVEQTIATMHALKAIGVKFAMDDFGTGYSSLTYLKRLPFDQLKIDQAFVRGLPEDAVGAAIVESIVAMSRALGIEVIAEGIETVSEFRALEVRGCHRYQGYLFSRPIPSADYESFLLTLPERTFSALT